jgi:hypothetical protein
VKEKKALTRSENKILEPLPSMFERHTEVFSKLVSQLIYQTLFFLKSSFEGGYYRDNWMGSQN